MTPPMTNNPEPSSGVENILNMSDDALAQAIGMMEEPLSDITNTNRANNNGNNNGGGGHAMCYSRLCGVMRLGQGSRQKINLRQQTIEEHDGSELYNLRDPVPIFQGQMMNTRGGWSLLMDGQSKIQPVRGRMRLPNGPLAFQIEDLELPRILWHVTERMMSNPKLRAHFPNAIPYIFDERFNIINCIDGMKCFDSERQEMINFYIPDDGYYSARLWLEIYGMYIYQPENQGNILVAKLKVKVGQIQLFTRLPRDKDGASNGNLRRTYEDICQFDN